jgi:hypothetical protein
MKLNELKSVLTQHREKSFKLLLPEGDAVPVSFHITEAGHVAKKFIDCGGRVHRVDTCQLQAWVGEDEDHRLEAGKLAGILEKATSAVLPEGADELPVEVEYEDCTISQYTIEDYAVADGAVVLRLGGKHTDCLAKELCIAPAGKEKAGASCCGGGC